jgi:hypothetical protein
LAIEYNNYWYIIEIKILRSYDTPAGVEEEGLEQIRSYRDKLAPLAPAYLVIFDRRDNAKQKPWDERIFWRQQGDITIVGG